MNTPDKIKTPFASGTGALKSTIPENGTVNDTEASMQMGFPPRTMSQETDRMPPTGEDMNGILYKVTDAVRFLQAGGTYPFDNNFCTAIGGYPLGAILTSQDSSVLYINTVANNTTNPEVNGTGWLAMDPIAGIDASPVSGSTNAVESGGVYTALAGKVDIDDADDAEVTATGSTTARTLANRFADVINVKDFGAKGDGTTDDTSALNAAMTAATGKMLFIPAGTYLTSTGLRIPSNTEVFGAGRTTTTIKLTADSFAIPCVTNAANVVGEESSNTGNENIVLRDLCVDGNGYRSNGTGSSGSSGSAISIKNGHHILIQNVMAVRGRLHCLDIASAQYTELYDPDNGKDWTVGASSFVRVENFIGYDAAVDDVITTHYSHDIQLVNCYAYAQDNSTRPFSLTFNQCGIEIDDGSYNVEVRGCYAKGFCRGIVAKAHNNGEATEAALPDREINFYDCHAEGNNINFEVMYHGTLRPVGSVGLYNCISTQPVEILTSDSGNRTSYFYFYGRGKNLVIDGFACKGVSSGSSNFGIYINPLSNVFPNGLNALSISNVTFDNVNVDSTGNSLIRITNTVVTSNIRNIIAQNCNDVPVIYETTDNLNNIDTVKAISSTALTSYVIVSNDETPLGAGRIKNITYQNYAGAFKNGNQYITTLNSTESVISSNETEIMAYRSSGYTLFKRLRMNRGNSKLPTGGGVGIAFGRKDSSGDLDDAYIRTDCAFSPGTANLAFGVRFQGETAPSDVWKIDTYSGAPFMPAVDNTYNIGTSNYRPKEIFAANGTINTSDERLKDNISDISDAVLDAWGDVNLKVFQFRDAIESKGESARLHAGVIAQQVQSAFEARGLDAFRFGLLCYDEWDDVFVTETIVDQEAVFDEEGNEVTPAVTHEEQRQVQEAGNRYSVRYTEALILEAAYQRRRADRIEARLAALEERLA